MSDRVDEIRALLPKRVRQQSPLSSETYLDHLCDECEWLIIEVDRLRAENVRLQRVKAEANSVLLAVCGQCGKALPACSECDFYALDVALSETEAAHA